MKNTAILPFTLPRQQQKASQALPLFATYNLGQAVWSERNTEAYIEDGYMKNWVLFTSVNDIATSAASIPLNVYRYSDKSLIESHPVLDLLRRPSPFQTDIEFFEAVYAFYKIAGNSYLEWSTMQETGEGQIPQELYSLPPVYMKVIAGKLYVAGYEFEYNGQKKRYEYDIINHKCRICHWKTFHPNDNWYGMSAVQAAAVNVDTHNQASVWNKSLLDNGARPSGALVYSPKGEDVDDTLTDEQYSSLKTRMEEQWSGAANRGRPVLLEGGLTWEQMSLTPADMDFLESKNTDAIGIANALGYPPFLLGLDTGQATFNNVAEAKLALYEETILPMIDSAKKKITNWMTPYFGDDWYLDYDADMIAALQPKRDKVWSRMEKADWMTINEKREATKLDPIEGGDIILVPSLQMPLEDMSENGTGRQRNRNDDEKQIDLSIADSKSFRGWMIENGYHLDHKNRDTTEHNKQIRIQNQFERSFDPRFKAFLNKQAKDVGSGYARNGKTGATKAIKDSEPELRKLLNTLYKKVMPASGQRVLEAFKCVDESIETKTEAESVFEMEIANWIEREAGVKVSQISSATRAKLQTILLEATSEGLGSLALSKRITEELGGEFAKARANTIARTEIHQSFNVANQTAAEATGLKLNKKWLATNDDRTRDSHKVVNRDNGILPLKKKFDVGNTKLAYPGDPEGEAGEVINCRCAVRHIPVD